VVDDPHPLHDLVAEHRADLRVGVAAVGAGGDEDHDIGVRDAELLEHGGDHLVARLRTGAVAHRDRDLGAARGQLAQRRAAHGLLQRPAQHVRLIRRARVVRGLDHGRPLLRELDLEPARSIRQPHLHVPRTLEGASSQA
jgi:hypothetical protein